MVEKNCMVKRQHVVEGNLIARSNVHLKVMLVWVGIECGNSKCGPLYMFSWGWK